MPPDQYGTYVGYYQRGNWAKFSTFFSKNLSRMEIKNLINQAYKNPISKNGGIIVGRTKSGMLIRIILEKENGVIFVKTAFPLYKNVGDVKSLMKILGTTKIAFEIKP